MSWLQIKKNYHFEVSSLLHLHNNKPFLDWMVICNKKCFLYDRWWPAQWLDLEEAPKHFPKPNLHRKNVSHCLVVCYLSDPLQPSEFQQKHYIWEACSANQWDALKTAMPAAGISQQNGPNSSLWQQLTACCIFQKLNELGYKVLPHPPYSPDLGSQQTTTSSSMLVTFCRENASITSKRQKMLAKSPEGQIFTLQE